MTIIKYLILSVALAIFTFSFGCSSDNDIERNEQHVEEQDHAESDVVELSDDDLKEFGIQLDTAGPGNIHIHVSLPGELVIPPDNLAHIHPRFPGIVKKVNKHIGDKVEKGDVLAVIESNESLSEYNIRSLISGILVEKHLTLGEVIEDSQHGFVVADLRTLWAYLEIYQKDLPFVQVGQEVVITAGPGMSEVKAKINYISPTIDETTRTSKARVIINNKKGKWKPGLFINGSVITSQIKVPISIPKTAIEIIEGNPTIFVQSEGGFEPRTIRIGRTNDINIEVLRGLEEGEIYVSKGAFTLKAELMKSEFGDDDH